MLTSSDSSSSSTSSSFLGSSAAGEAPAPPNERRYRTPRIFCWTPAEASTRAEMKIVAENLLAVLGGNSHPSSDDIRSILESGEQPFRFAFSIDTFIRRCDPCFAQWERRGITTGSISSCTKSPIRTSCRKALGRKIINLQRIIGPLAQ